MPQIYAADYYAKFAASYPAVKAYLPTIYATIYGASAAINSPSLGQPEAVGFPSFYDAGGVMTGGTSGSPDMILLPTATGQTLAMFEGRTTSGISAQMLADINALNVASGLDTNNPDYQPVILDLSSYPNL